MFGRREIARHKEIKAVSQTLIINKRIPVSLLQLFEIENLAVDIVFQNPDIDLVCARQFRDVTKLFEFLAELFGPGQFFCARLG